MDNDKAAWVAGFLEAEGAFVKEISRRGYVRIGISVSLTDKDVLERLQRHVPEGAITGPFEHPADSVGKQPYWKWTLRRRMPVVELLQQIRPRMGERRTRQIDALLELHALYPHLLSGRKHVLKEHGTRARYYQGCRCAACRAASAAYQRERIAARRRHEA